MEENRLKQMPENYDRAVFESIYSKTKNLRNKLAYGIDARRFGVDQDEIKSWFDVNKLAIWETSDIDNSQFDRGVVYGFHKGFQKALELTARFTEDDMVEMANYGMWYALNSQHSGEVPRGNVLQKIQSKPKSWEVEYKEENGIFKITKIL